MAFSWLAASSAAICVDKLGRHRADTRTFPGRREGPWGFGLVVLMFPVVLSRSGAARVVQRDDAAMRRREQARALRELDSRSANHARWAPAMRRRALHAVDSQRRGSLPDQQVAFGRLLGCDEQLFLSLRRFTSTNVVRVAVLEGAPPPEIIRSVLPLLQARHPLLNVHVVEGRSPAFSSLGTPPLLLRSIERRDDEHWSELLEQMLNRPLPQRPGPLLQLHYLYRPDQGRAELFLVADHVICDGLSINALCAELLSLCAGDDVREPRKPQPALDALLPPFAPHRRLASFARQLASFAWTSLLRHSLETRSHGETTGFATISLSAAETALLLQRARREETTLT